MTHVVPVNDLIEHRCDGDTCPCGPAVEFTADGPLYTHHSLDGRERFEDPPGRHLVPGPDS